MLVFLFINWDKYHWSIYDLSKTKRFEIWNTWDWLRTCNHEVPQELHRSAWPGQVPLVFLAETDGAVVRGHGPSHGQQGTGYRPKLMQHWGTMNNEPDLNHRLKTSDLIMLNYSYHLINHNMCFSVILVKYIHFNKSTVSLTNKFTTVICTNDQCTAQIQIVNK